MQAWREGRGRGKEEKERHTGKRGEETKISVFVEAELQGPSKSEKKLQVRRGGQNGGGSENGWAGHTQPASHTVKKLFFFNGWRTSLSVLFQSKGSRIEPQPFLVRYLPF